MAEGEGIQAGSCESAPGSRSASRLGHVDHAPNPAEQSRCSVGPRAPADLEGGPQAGQADSRCQPDPESRSLEMMRGKRSEIPSPKQTRLQLDTTGPEERDTPARSRYARAR